MTPIKEQIYMQVLS